MKKLALVFLLISSFFSLNVKGVLAATAARIGTTEIYQERNGQKCNFITSCVQAGEDVQVVLTDISYSNGRPVNDGEMIRVYLNATTNNCRINYPGYSYETYAEVRDGKTSKTFSGNYLKANCSYKLTIVIPQDPNDKKNTSKSTKTYSASPVASLQCGTTADQCKTDLSMVASYDLCKQQLKEGTDQFEACQECFSGNGIWTAVGCIPSNPESVIKTVITIGLTAGGGIVLIMILVGSFMLSVSQGDPNKAKEAKEIITSAIIGLLFVIFSVTILQFIGVSILHIPGFGG